MKPSVRTARPADVDAVAAIESAWPTAAGWKKEQFAEEFNNRASRFFVAEENGALVGYAVLRVVPPQAQLLDIAVRPNSTRRGLGRLLLDDALARSRHEGLKKMTLEVSSINGAGLSLYRSAGFAVVGRRPKFYNDGSDAVLMDLDLA